MTKNTYVAYYRVSTSGQERSGLGLEAQRKAVLDYINGSGSAVLAEYTETESGKRNDRPQLARAIAHCRRKKATLVIARLDRLSRNLHFISGLMEAKVPFVAADAPWANELMLHLLAAFAQHERKMISERTKNALAAAKARGVKLGCPCPAKGAAKGAAVQRERAQQRAATVMAFISQARSAGAATEQQIADALNAKGVPTARGGEWTTWSVRNVLARQAA